MNKKLLKIFKVIGLFLAAFVVILLIFTTVMSYRAIDALTESVKIKTKYLPAPSHSLVEVNVKEPAITSHEIAGADKDSQPVEALYAFRLFNELEDIDIEMTKHSNIPICEIICRQSVFSKDKMPKIDGFSSGENFMNYLIQFYQNEGLRAFDDPKYRVSLEYITAFTSAIPRSFRNLTRDLDSKINQIDEMSEMEKVRFSMELQYVFFKEAKNLLDNLDKARTRAKRAQEMIELQKSCADLDAQEVTNQCEVIQTKEYPKLKKKFSSSLKSHKNYIDTFL